MKLSDYVVSVLQKQGVSHVFEFIGGAIVHLIDSIASAPGIECVSVRHEQAGAFAAEAYARMNGKLGVAMATSGPGALNLLTGIGSCYFDSVPCLFITGQVNTYEYKFERPIRQIGFQETDIVSVAKSLTKHAELVSDPSEIRFALEKAIYLAQSGRPGPVLLDIPMNLQRADIEPDTLVSFFDSPEYKQSLPAKKEAEASATDRLFELLAQAERPLILAGGGIRSAGVSEQLCRLIEQTGIPMVHSLMGIDAIPHDSEYYYGMIGSYGNRYSNLAVANCDLLLILGSRLDSRQTGTRPDTFARGAVKIHVDVDALELGSKVVTDLNIQSDLRSFFEEIGPHADRFERQDLSDWLAVLQQFKHRYPTRSFAPANGEIEPNRFFETVSAKGRQFGSVVLDVGQHQMWASQSYRLFPGQRLLNSGGMGAMGFALPAAIGACLASGQPSLVIAGDGGVQLNIQELNTIARLRLPVKVLVLNNHSLGMVRQFQDLYFEGRQQSTVLENPDFANLGRAYGIPAFQMSFSNEMQELEHFLAVEGPALIEVVLTRKCEVYPKLIVNRPIEDMYPHLDRDELRDIMLIDLVEEMEVPK